MSFAGSLAYEWRLGLKQEMASPRTVIEEGYYSSLAPFREYFRTGLPILTYHKLGQRPRRVKLKGLYVSDKLFRQQLGELHDAGFEAISLDALGGSPSPASGARVGVRRQFVVLTFDDGCENVLEHGVPALREFGFQAIQFIVTDQIGGRNEWDADEAPERLMTTQQIREWLAAGHQIGSHTLTHPFLTQLPPDRAREEIASSKKKLEDLFGLEIRHFCYPYGDWNPAVRDLVQAAGYQTACTTDFGINTRGQTPFALKRITARYPTRNWKAVRKFCANLLRRSAS
jgi:peptidoglycan/xylan/chitin deacetylase (PgdA/CDA1 family)